jgi:hypothetical protein
MYGEVIRVSAPVGVRSSSSPFLSTGHAQLTFVYSQQEYILISDPKALQHIYHTSGYKYARHKERAAIGGLASGRGLGTAEGGYIRQICMPHSSIFSWHPSFFSSESHVCLVALFTIRWHPQEAKEGHAASIRSIRIKSTDSDF